MKKDKTLSYNTILALSVADIVGAIGSLAYAVYTGIAMIQSNLGAKQATFTLTGGAQVAEKTSLFSGEYYQYMVIVICVFAGAILLALYPALTKKRQKLRDEVEYDDNGLSKKFGSFSQLSRKEREAIDKQKLVDSERILPSTQVKSLTHKGPDEPLKELNDLIGLIEVKRDIIRMEARMKYEREELDKHQREEDKISHSLFAGSGKKKTGNEGKTNTLSAMHMIFYGAPGTGKTTVARIMTSFLYKYGYIKENKSIEIDGTFFDGLSTGESSRKCNMLIKKALGGVLFIDEAYSILDSNGQEVIASIVKAMEDNKGEIVFIFAGYSKEMRRFVDSNPGIESRVKHYMYFNNYDEQELRQIFVSMANQQGLCVNDCLLDKVADYLVTLSRQKNFGNARTARNLLDKIIDEHAYNLETGALTSEYKFMLMPNDMITADQRETIKTRKLDD